MNLISAKISTSSQQLFLIDIVPSLTSIQKGDSYMKQKFHQEMANFERRVRLLFTKMRSVDQSRYSSFKPYRLLNVRRFDQ